MTKEQKNIIIKFFSWLLLGIVIVIIGVSNVFALENDGRIYFYDNNGSSASEVSTTYVNQTDWSGAQFTTTANSYGGLVVIALNQPLIKNHIYTIFLNVGAESNGGYTRLSTKNCIGIAQTKNGAVSNYVNCGISPRFSDYTYETGDKTRGVYFTFIANNNATFLALAYTSQYTCNNCMQYSYGYELNDAGDSSSMTESQVNNIINQQTNNINNSITNSTNTIVDNSNTNKQAIIDNQNENTEKTNDVLNNQLGNKCTNLLNPTLRTSLTHRGITFTPTLNNDGIVESYTLNGTRNDGNQSYAKIGNLSIDSGTKVKVYSDARIGVQLWDENNNRGIGNNGGIYYDSYTFTSDYNNVGIYIYTELDSINNAEFKVMISKEDTKYCVYGSYNSKLDTTNEQLEEQNKTSKGILGKLGELITNLFSNDGPDTEQFNDMAGWLPPGPIDSILTLPLTLLNSMNNALGGTCVTFTAPIPFVNNNFTFPCFSSLISQIDGGNTLWSWVGAIASVLILYKYLIALYEWVDNVLMLRYNLHEDLGGNSANFGGV